MPRLLLNYFRDLEVKIVSEIAWQNGSPVVEVIKTLIKNQELDHNTTQEQDKNL